MESKLKENSNNIGKKRGRKPKPKEEKNENDHSFPKKRGRKPKPKEEKHENDNSFPKKRGRKPKPKHPLELLAKVPKKRGRKPKDKYGFGMSQVKPINNVTFNNDNENIILHLPIHSCQLMNNEFVEQKLLEYNPNISVPTPYEEIFHSNPFISNYSSPYPFDKHESIEQEKFSNDSEENSKTNSEDSESDSQENVYRKMNLKYEDKNIFYDNKGNETMECQYEENNFKIKMSNNINSSQSSKNTMLQFKEANVRNKWPESTNIYCWWCCSPFTNVPCALPLRKKNEEYIVSGCFCSPECAAAWNFDNSDSEERWERNSLLNVIYKKVFENKNINIKPAPPRQSLKIFGGNLTIEEFRKNNCNYNKNYKIVMPPMISIIPQIEESINNSFYNHGNSFIPIDKERIEKANKDLKLKRSKPLSEKRNTLENCMKLKYL